MNFSRMEELEEVRGFAYLVIKDNPSITGVELRRKLSESGYDVSELNMNTINGWIHRVKVGQAIFAETKAKIIPNVRQLRDAVPPSLEQATEAVVRAFEQAAKVPALEAEINELRNKLAATRNELTVLREAEAERQHQKLRYQQALQSGELNQPL